MIRPQDVSKHNVMLKVCIALIFILDSQKTTRAFTVKTYKWTLTRVSDLCCDGSVILPLHYFAYITQRQQNPSDDGLRSNRKLHFSRMYQEMSHQNL
jgi:hypothetical protein